jgi:two-component system LytT family response regulator
MRILIVDDERPAREKLQRMLMQQLEHAQIEQAADAVQAMACVEQTQFDVLFLDIHLPEISGLEFAASLPEVAMPAGRQPLIVFVTAYDEYALAAFDANAIDYLLKPYDAARLQRALARVHERMQVHMQAPTTPSLPAPIFAAPSMALRQLLVSMRGVTQVIAIEQIEWLETAGNYVILHTAESQPLLRQTLAGLLEKLDQRFVRCHRRAAVQIALVASMQNLEKGDAELILHSGARVPCSRAFRASVLEKLAAR